MSKLLRHKKHLPSNTLKKKHNVHDDSVVNPRRACAARVTVLSLCVCVSVTQHLTFYVFIRATNDTNLLGGG